LNGTASTAVNALPEQTKRASALLNPQTHSENPGNNPQNKQRHNYFVVRCKHLQGLVAGEIPRAEFGEHESL
jgi:hypothetical protein